MSGEVKFFSVIDDEKRGTGELLFLKAVLEFLKERGVGLEGDDNGFDSHILNPRPAAAANTTLHLNWGSLPFCRVRNCRSSIQARLDRRPVFQFG